MANEDKVEILDSKEKTLDELGVNNEGEITEGNFIKFLGMVGKIDFKTLEKFVTQIPNRIN